VPVANYRAMRAALLVLSLALGCRRAPPAPTSAPPGTRWVVGNEDHWRGWIELVPSVRTPRFTNLQDQTRIFARFSPGARITLRDPSDRRSLVMPPGSELDRVELFSLDGAARVVDVRGTEFTAQGEVFHVYRPIDARGGGLFGAWWPRADEPPPGVLRAMTDAMRAGHGLAGVHPDRHARAIRRFEGLLRCAGCHHAQQPLRAGAPDEWPRRETDASGIYSVLATLRDADVVETYRPRDLNAGAPFVTVVRDRSGVSVATLHTAEARRAGDPHARAVCASRAALRPFLADEVRQAFAAELAECAASGDSL
jgi:hypothetical protein